MVLATEQLKEKKGDSYTPLSYSRNKHSGPGRVDKPPHARNSNHRNNSRMRKPSGNYYPSTNYGDKKCNYCHKPGHIEANCRHKMWREQSKKGKDQH